MRIAVVGAGPAGLFFAGCLKARNPHHDVSVFEQRRRGAPSGFGVGLSEQGLLEVRTLDASLGALIQEAAVRIDTIALHYKGRSAKAETRPFWAISRSILLDSLLSRAVAAGVRVVSGHRIEGLGSLPEFDLVVGADGIGSAIRKGFDRQFGPSMAICANRIVWYGAELFHPDIRLVFRPLESGLLIAHVYPFSSTWSTFVVECDEAAWFGTGLAEMSDEARRRYCETVFRDILDGRSLAADEAQWFRPKFLMMRHWYHKNAALIGDAVKSLHPSIGAGTQAAFEDAGALIRALEEFGPELSTALDAYERNRKPRAERQQRKARASTRWYEALSNAEFSDVGAMADSFMARTRHPSLQECLGTSSI